MTDIKNEVAPELPKCPKCGSDARRVEYQCEMVYENTLKPTGDTCHKARVECAENGGKCYHTDWYLFPDDSYYRANFSTPNPSYVPQGIDHGLQWMYIDAQWTRLALTYWHKKGYRDQLDLQRCSCGRVQDKNDNYCPNCGAKVVKK